MMSDILDFINLAAEYKDMQDTADFADKDKEAEDVEQYPSHARKALWSYENSLVEAFKGAVKATIT